MKAGWFIDQRRKGQERTISITIANKEVAMMQMWFKSKSLIIAKKAKIRTKI